LDAGMGCDGELEGAVGTAEKMLADVNRCSGEHELEVLRHR
jgi:hypothetical protein